MDVPHCSGRYVYTVSSRADGRDEVLALRAWRFCTERVTNRTLLTSVTEQLIWTGPVRVATWEEQWLIPRGGGYGGYRCRVRSQLRREGWFYGPGVWAWGWVALSGLVRELGHAYFAQTSAIRQLRLGPRALAYFASREAAGELVADLEDRYQCRVKIGYPEWRVSRAMRAAPERGGSD